MEWTGARNRQGYGNFAVDRGGPRWRTEMAHRVALELHQGFPVAQWVLHRCDNPPCCNPDHLYEGSPLQNAKDRDGRGRGGDMKSIAATRNGVKGERVNTARLTADQVAEIERAYRAGAMNQRELGEMYGVNQTTISRVVLGQTWAHVDRVHA